MSDSKDSTGKTGGSPFNRTAQHDAKRSAILSQAARLFNGRGSRSTTLLDIAQSLGLTKTSLYYYVKTKEELIYQCYIAALDQAVHAARSGAQTPQEALTETAEAWTALSQELGLESQREAYTRSLGLEP